MKRATVVVLLAGLFGCDDEPDEDVIGRLDGGGGNEVVRRWEFSITYPEGSANDARALHASLARMR